ncbi:uncharacterized protein LOC143434569 isoform X2 [Arvicanthis niloticus]|uniref:uncharacterized protein LOC143308869 isoform X2 n=1 Tax=Arvicanthis niloticus TaxID=61156 RepID=UPI00402BA3F6
MDVSQVRSPVNMKKKFPVHTPNLCKFARWHSFSIEAKRSSKEIKEDTAFHQEDIVHIYISLSSMYVVLSPPDPLPSVSSLEKNRPPRDERQTRQTRFPYLG